jgi:hypothetical protein
VYTYQRGSLFDQGNLLLLQDLRSLILVDYEFRIRLLFGILHQTAVELDELLETVVAARDGTSRFLDQLIFSLHFFKQMRDFCRQIRDCIFAGSACAQAW